MPRWHRIGGAALPRLWTSWLPIPRRLSASYLEGDKSTSSYGPSTLTLTIVTGIGADNGLGGQRSHRMTGFREPPNRLVRFRSSARRNAQ